MQATRLAWPAATIVCLNLIAGVLSSGHAQIIWNFTSDAAGWESAGLTCGSYRTSLATYPVTWQAPGGDPGGYINRADPTSNCFFFEAPAGRLGDLSIYEGGQLQFRPKSTHNIWSQDNVVVLVGANSLVLVAVVTPLPESSWHRYEVPLLAGSFRYDTKAGAVCS